jgi:predicted outer membrane repeat protein
MMAGLLPQLQTGALPGSQDWTYLKPMVPGQRPLESLALTLAGLLPERSMKTIREDLEDDSARGLHLLATHVLQRADAKAVNPRVVFVIDQFEELFTQTLTEEERRRFLDLLIAAVTEPRGPVVALITLRADFSDRPMHYPDLSHLIELHHKSVLPMNIQDLRAVIERPASLPDVQLTFEGDLVGDLLFESHNQIGILPLLEFTLDQLFQLREGHRLTLQAYQQIGGVKGALAKQAESTYNSLPSEEHRRLARVLFLRLIAPNMTEQVATRRRATLSELSLPDAKQTATIHQVLDAFVAARLLTTNEFAGTTTVEISHEALIRAWGRLSDWLREDSEDLHLQQIISADAIEWERRGKPKDRLYRGSQLSEASIWARRNTPNQNEQAFLGASVAQQRRSRLNVVAVVLLLVLTAGLLFQFTQSQLTPATVVMNTQDAGPGSLRQIIDHAPSGSTITVRPGLKGIITLTNGDLDIKQPLTIIGPGPGALIISSGTRGYRVKIEPSAVVSISGVSFQNSKNLTSGFIYNGGNLTLTNSNVSGNSSGDLDSREGFGGGISNFGVLTVSHSLISGNKATRKGGGISNYGLLTLTDTIISGNSTTGDGGGIYTDSSGSLSLTNSTVSGNTADGDGGGIASNGFSNGGPLSLTRSTISGNTASGNGGGISNYGHLTLTNSTISDNRAAHNGGGIFDGGTTSQANLSFCTLYGNSASGQGGAIFQESPTPSSDTQVTACIVAGNSAAIHAGITGILTSNGYNLLQNMADLAFTPAGLHNTDRDVQDTDLTRIFSAPVQLRNNGGSTQTYALSPNIANPALDQVPLTLCQLDGMSTDQRSIKRPDGNERFCDIGAYETVD